MWKRVRHDLTILSATMLVTVMVMLFVGISRAQIDWAEDDDDPGELSNCIHTIVLSLFDGCKHILVGKNVTYRGKSTFN